MRGKKVINNNQVLQNTNHKIDHNRPHLKKRINQVKSLEPKIKTQTVLPQTQKLIKLPMQNTVNDYQFERRQRLTQQFISNKGPTNVVFTVQGAPEINRFQRNTEGVITGKNRQNYFLNQQQRSNQNSLQRIKLVSADSKQKSLSRSENNSAKKRGIELTKTLLKRISGMYNDKDFQNRSSFINKSSNKDETTGMTLSGRGIYDEYQISDFDFQVPPNHTFNISSSNPLSFNDSGNWNRNSGYCNSNNSANKSSWNRKSNQFIKIDQKPHENSRIKPQSNHSRQRIVFCTPQKQLMKVRSYNLLGTQVTADSIVVGQEPPPRPVESRRGAQAIPHQSQDRQRYLIRSKNKTMEQLSLKQSMVVDFDQHYYQ